MSEEDHKCPASETGICGVHWVEVERRRANDKHVDELKISVEEIHAAMAAIGTFTGQLKIVGVVALAIWAGSFVYTYTASSSLEGYIDRLRENYTRHDREISDLRANQLVINERYIRLLERIETTNTRLSQLINRIPAPRFGDEDGRPNEESE